MMEKLLIVDDNAEIIKQLKWGLGKEYDLYSAKNVTDAYALFVKQQPKVVLLDLGLYPLENGTEEGFRCLEEMLKGKPLTKIIVITGNSEREHALRAIQSGAYDFYQKPINLKELKVIIHRAFYLDALEEENRTLQRELEKKNSTMFGMLGQCPEILDVFATIRKVATSDIPILIQGESGTGKELVALALHSLSLRREGPFIPINCGAIPENLLESELFGHEKGAFTGANAQVMGKVEYANNGSLLLDEVGELPFSLQVKLLRFLQEKRIQRVGGREHIVVDARIVAASNKDITKEIEGNRFREDLFFRISVITINLPPLRERGDDIIVLSNFFLKKFSKQFSRKMNGFSPSALDFIKSYEWPGNVRELENRIQRAIIMSEDMFIESHDLGFKEASTAQTGKEKKGMTLREVRTQVEKDIILSTLNRHGGNIVRSAEDLGVSRPTLYDLMKKYGISNISDKSHINNNFIVNN
jgi:two-component system NtrC family response regulator